MTKLLDEAIERLRALPEDRQDMAAHALEVIAAQMDSGALSDDEIDGVYAAQADVGRGHLASDKDVRALFGTRRA